MFLKRKRSTHFLQYVFPLPLSWKLTITQQAVISQTCDDFRHRTRIKTLYTWAFVSDYNKWLNYLKEFTFKFLGQCQSTTGSPCLGTFESGPAIGQKTHHQHILPTNPWRFRNLQHFIPSLCRLLFE